MFKFMPDEVKTLEYTKDLSSYYEFGYGSEMNRYIQCSTVHDMVSQLDLMQILELTFTLDIHRVHCYT